MANVQGTAKQLLLCYHCLLMMNGNYHYLCFWQVFDRDGNGFISRAELSHVMRNIGENLSEDDLNEMISEADRNGDGLIDYQEFVGMLSKK